MDLPRLIILFIGADQETVDRIKHDLIASARVGHFDALVFEDFASANRHLMTAERAPDLIYISLEANPGEDPEAGCADVADALTALSSSPTTSIVIDDDDLIAATACFELENMLVYNHDKFVDVAEKYRAEQKTLPAA